MKDVLPADSTAIRFRYRDGEAMVSSRERIWRFSLMRFAGTQPGLGPGQRLHEAFPGDGLEQIVDRVDLESANRVLVMGGYEHDRRHLLRSDFVHHGEPVHLRHLHVEKHQVRPSFADPLDGFAAVLRFLNGSDLGIVRQQHPQALARQRFIIHDQHCQRHGGRFPEFRRRRDRAWSWWRPRLARRFPP